MVDKATFNLQCDLIADALNVIWADQETRSPHHPLRQLNELFGFNATALLWGTRHDYVDAVYDEGRFPSRAVEPQASVIPAPAVAISGTILKAVGTGIFDPATFELDGDFKQGDTITVEGTLTGATLPTWGTGALVVPYDMSREGAAALLSSALRGIDELSSNTTGNKVNVFNIGGAATAVEITVLTVV